LRRSIRAFYNRLASLVRRATKPRSVHKKAARHRTKANAFFEEGCLLGSQRRLR
jgi:hypothetical protein